MKLGMEITRKDVEVMVDKILNGQVVVSDFTDENLGGQMVEMVKYYHRSYYGKAYIIDKATECLSEYFKKVGADFAEIFKEPEVLDEVEKAYLGNILKPFIRKYKTIKVEKYRGYLGRVEWIEILLYEDEDGDDDVIEFPAFEAGTMYKGMEADRVYTVEELGLK